jgi:hypothetical protein
VITATIAAIKGRMTHEAMPATRLTIAIVLVGGLSDPGVLGGWLGYSDIL